jgi:hypothetical protein
MEAVKPYPEPKKRLVNRDPMGWIAPLSAMTSPTGTSPL